MVNTHGELVVEEPELLGQQAQQLTQTPQVQAAKKQLFKVKGFWPLDFFPDELTIEDKMIIIKRNILLASNTETIMVKDVTEVTITSTAFLSAITFHTSMPDRVITMANIPHDKAKAAKELLDGLMIRERA